MRPVVAADGITYERSEIRSWFRREGAISPATNLPLQDRRLVANLTLKSVVEEMRGSDPDLLRPVPIIDQVDYNELEAHLFRLARARAANAAQPQAQLPDGLTMREAVEDVLGYLVDQSAAGQGQLVRSSHTLAALLQERAVSEEMLRAEARSATRSAAWRAAATQLCEAALAQRAQLALRPAQQMARRREAVPRRNRVEEGDEVDVCTIRHPSILVELKAD